MRNGLHPGRIGFVHFPIVGQEAIDLVFHVGNLGDDGGTKSVFGGGTEQIKGLLKKLIPEKPDSGDLLLLLVVLLLWREEEDNDLLLALGAALLMGDGT